jgi:hypothetical protein
MKKLYIIMLVLIVALVMNVSMVMPVAACHNAKPVSWVSWVTNEKQHLPDWPYTTRCVGMVKQLSDGTTVGYYISHDIDATTAEKRTYSCDTYTSSDFHDNVAEFYGNSYCKETGQTIRIHEILIDNGEPGRYKDEIMAWVWLPDCGFPDVPYWWPILGPQDNMDDPAFGLPVKITTGNIQVHVGHVK